MAAERDEDNVEVVLATKSMNRTAALVTVCLGVFAIWGYSTWEGEEQFSEGVVFLRVMDPLVALGTAIIGVLLLAVVYQLRMLRAELADARADLLE